MASFEYHQLALTRLCFVCGEICDTATIHDAEPNIKDINVAFQSTFQLLPDVTPSNLCHTCYRTVTSICKGSSLSTTKVPIAWTAHSLICQACELFAKKQVGGRKRKVIYDMMHSFS